MTSIWPVLIILSSNFNPNASTKDLHHLHEAITYPTTPLPTMRAFHRLLMASPTNLGAGNPLNTGRGLALLPPIPLYRRVLRAHRKLPREMRVLGDEYAKSEFRAHKNVDNPVHIVRLLATLFGGEGVIRNSILICFIVRLRFFRNGNSTRRLSRVIHGETARWIRRRLIR